MTLPVPTDQNAATKQKPLSSDSPVQSVLGEATGCTGDHVTEAALRLWDAVGFDFITACRLAGAGYDVLGWTPVMEAGVAT